MAYGALAGLTVGFQLASTFVTAIGEKHPEAYAMVYALERMLREMAMGLTQVSLDKYFGIMDRMFREDPDGSFYDLVLQAIMAIDED